MDIQTRGECPECGGLSGFHEVRCASRGRSVVPVAEVATVLQTCLEMMKLSQKRFEASEAEREVLAEKVKSLEYDLRNALNYLAEGKSKFAPNTTNSDVDMLLRKHGRIL